MSPASGERFGRYTVVGKIGHGGMGDVYLATDTVLERRVALKLLSGKSHNDRIARKRLISEAKCAAAIDHPYVCKIYEAGETDATAFIAMEYVEGCTLADRMRKGPLSWEEFHHVAQEVSEALAQAHEQGVTHRDLKPSNIMLTSGGHVKLLDFGLAHRFVPAPADAETDTALTSPGLLAGTLVYMPPEQFRGLTLDRRTDIFSLGLVLYEALTGVHPFRRETSIATAVAIAGDPLPPLRLDEGAVPPGVERLLAWMLAKNPDERCQSAGDVLEVLRALEARWTGDSAAILPGVDTAGSATRAMVGREAEREILRRGYVRVKGGNGLLLAISGEPGIGKTSLGEMFLAELALREDRPIVARGRCAEQLAGAEAYLPVLEALENLVHGQAGAAAGEALKTIAPTWRQQVATIESTDSGIVRDLPAASQERMKRELAALLTELSQARPVALFLEDLHWADVSTVDILSFLASRFAGMRVLIIVTYRAAEMAAARHPFLAIANDLQSRGCFVDVSLDFLGLPDVERYLALTYPRNAFPPAFAKMIHARTEGSPLFVVDLVRYLRDSGAIRQEDGTWVLSGSLPESPRELPASVKGIIARKIEMLDAEDRRLLVAASVQGHEFDTATLAEAAEMDPAVVEERLEQLDRIHLFVRRGEEREFPDRTLTLTYRFVHVLYQNVLYASLQPTRRATLSGRAARSMVAHHGEEIAPIAGRVALLFESARDFAASAKYFLAAAQYAVELFAFREALSLADRGLNAVRALGSGPEAKQLELGLQMAKGVALRSTTGWATPEIEETFLRARAISEELGNPPQTLPVLWAVSLFHLIRGNLVECRDLSDELAAKGSAVESPPLMMAGYHLAGVSREFLGDMVESSRLLKLSRELHRPEQHAMYTAMYGVDPGILARAMYSRPLWVLGYPDRALEIARETVMLARPQRQPLTYSFAMLVLEGVLAYRGEGAEAVAVGDENIALCREHGLPQEAEWSRSFKGYALVTLGRVSEGIELLKDSLEVQAHLKTRLARSMYLALLAEGLRQAGRIAEGLKAIDEGLHYAAWISEGGYVAELYRMRGELLRAAGDHIAAEDAFQQALDRAVQQQARSFDLRASIGLARLLADRDDLPAARAVLTPVHKSFTEGHSTSDLSAARKLLSEIG